jgi:hypothetical protein
MACRDCKRCTNSKLANFGRRTGRLVAFAYSVGISEAVMATQKKCRECGHQMSLHGADKVGWAPQPTVQAQNLVQVKQQPAPTPPPPTPEQAAPPPAALPPPGWYYPNGTDEPPRWWDGAAWADIPPPPAT